MGMFYVRGRQLHRYLVWRYDILRQMYIKTVEYSTKDGWDHHQIKKFNTNPLCGLILPSLMGDFYVFMHCQNVETMPCERWEQYTEGSWKTQNCCMGEDDREDECWCRDWKPESPCIYKLFIENTMFAFCVQHLPWVRDWFFKTADHYLVSLTEQYLQRDSPYIAAYQKERGLPADRTILQMFQTLMNGRYKTGVTYHHITRTLTNVVQVMVPPLDEGEDIWIQKHGELQNHFDNLMHGDDEGVGDEQEQEQEEEDGEIETQ